MTKDRYTLTIAHFGRDYRWHRADILFQRPSVITYHFWFCTEQRYQQINLHYCIYTTVKRKYCQNKSKLIARIYCTRTIYLNSLSVYFTVYCTRTVFIERKTNNRENWAISFHCLSSKIAKLWRRNKLYFQTPHLALIDSAGVKTGDFFQVVFSSKCDMSSWIKK